MAFIQIPPELGQLLSQSTDATNAFSMMTPDQKKAVIHRALSAKTKHAQQKLIHELAKEGRC